MIDAELGDVPELDLHGARGHEVSYRVDEFLHHAWMAGDRAVRIIHGHGDGTVRLRVLEVLRSHPLVLEYGGIARGGGVGAATAVVLKER